jgi:hypothetical protein
MAGTIAAHFRRSLKRSARGELLVAPYKPEAPAKDPRQTVASGPSLALQAGLGRRFAAAIHYFVSAKVHWRIVVSKPVEKSVWPAAYMLATVPVCPEAV